MLKHINSSGYVVPLNEGDIIWYSKITGTLDPTIFKVGVVVSEDRLYTAKIDAFGGTFFEILNSPLRPTTSIDLYSGLNLLVLNILIKFEVPELLQKEVEGEFIETITIDGIGSFQVGVEAEKLNEDLVINLANKGLELTGYEARAFKDSNSLSDVRDSRLLNDKYIQLLVGYNTLLMNKGSESSLVGLLKWFGFDGKLMLKMVYSYNPVNDIEYYQEIPFDQVYNTSEYPKIKKFKNIIHFVSEEYTPTDESLRMWKWKMYLLQLFFSSHFLPIHLKIGQSVHRTDPTQSLIPLQVNISDHISIQDNISYNLEDLKINGQPWSPFGSNILNRSSKQGGPISTSTEDLVPVPPKKDSIVNLSDPNSIPMQDIGKMGFWRFLPNGFSSTIKKFEHRNSGIGIIVRLDFPEVVKVQQYDGNGQLLPYVQYTNGLCFISHKTKWLSLFFEGTGQVMEYPVNLNGQLWVHTYIAKIDILSTGEPGSMWDDMDVLGYHDSANIFKKQDFPLIEIDLNKNKLGTWLKQGRIPITKYPSKDRKFTIEPTRGKVLVLQGHWKDYPIQNGVWIVSGSEDYHTPTYWISKEGNYPIRFRGTIDGIDFEVSKEIEVRVT